MANMDIGVTFITQTYQQRLNSNPYVPRRSGRAMLGANGVAILHRILVQRPRRRCTVAARCR